jgi:hypothetical protein
MSPLQAYRTAKPSGLRGAKEHRSMQRLCLGRGKPRQELDRLILEVRHPVRVGIKPCVPPSIAEARADAVRP